MKLRFNKLNTSSNMLEVNFGNKTKSFDAKEFDDIKANGISFEESDLKDNSLTDIQIKTVVNNVDKFKTFKDGITAVVSANVSDISTSYKDTGDKDYIVEADDNGNNTIYFSDDVESDVATGVINTTDNISSIYYMGNNYSIVDLITNINNANIYCLHKPAKLAYAWVNIQTESYVSTSIYYTKDLSGATELYDSNGHYIRTVSGWYNCSAFYISSSSSSYSSCGGYSSDSGTRYFRDSTYDLPYEKVFGTTNKTEETIDDRTWVYDNTSIANAFKYDEYGRALASHFYTKTSTPNIGENIYFDEDCTNAYTTCGYTDTISEYNKYKIKLHYAQTNLIKKSVIPTMTSWTSTDSGTITIYTLSDTPSSGDEVIGIEGDAVLSYITDTSSGRPYITTNYYPSYYFTKND